LLPRWHRNGTLTNQVVVTTLESTNTTVGRSRGGLMTPPAKRAAMIARASVRA
jgi:hypothetical protein